MGFESTSLGIAASVFLGIYVPYTVLVLFVCYKKGFKTAYLFLLFFSVVRLGGQFCGVVYAKIGAQYWKWLVAYLVLGAEGYFALIFAAFRLICEAQKAKYGTLWLEKSGPPVHGPLPKRLVGTWAALFRTVLIPANVCVIVGGIMLAGLNTDNAHDAEDAIHRSKILRTIGQSLFVSLSAVTALVNLRALVLENLAGTNTYCVLAASPFLLVRGVFGVLSIYLPQMNYFNFSNYTDGKSHTSMIIYEYVLSTTMEFVASAFLLATAAGTQPIYLRQYAAYEKESFDGEWLQNTAGRAGP